MAAILALALALAAVLVTLISFRGLLFLTIPLALAALLIGVLSAARAHAGGGYGAAIVAVVLAGLVLVLSMLALVANILISSDYELY